MRTLNPCWIGLVGFFLNFSSGLILQGRIGDESPINPCNDESVMCFYKIMSETSFNNLYIYIYMII
jgi:hypothetical protein